jgi:hypothetical protein
MDERMTKQQLIATLRERRMAWDATMARVPSQRMAEPGVDGTWSVKDIVAHLGYYERWYADRMGEMLRGERYEPNELDRLHYEDRNVRVYEQNRDRPADELLRESREAFERLIAAVEAHDESFLIEPQGFEGAPGPQFVWKMLRGDVYDHYGPHIAAVERWLARKDERA